MADDTRRIPTTTSDAASSSDPNVRQSGTKYESFVPAASGDNPNVMPGGTQHTAGGEKIGGVSLSDGFKTIQPKDFLEIHKYPCVREAILTSIGTGFGTGGLMAIWGKSIAKSCNWAAGVFVFTSMASYEFCKQKQRLEREGMARAVEIMDRKREEKRAKRQEIIAARRKAKEESDRLEEERMNAAQKPWWKVW
ncbi:Cox20/FAM36A [Lasiodiplodia theobromae]|uniref:uncharacterized protein n=1 Tax=Lasiodiplodia theobromae TaxID=45133 RepID=UPI0015C356A0|nr:uncharacterized protein LTHEOB_1775 [Lasiodiplodia theobromae]KAF4537584.1 hypothetical protein LTHEOB_1775 [Lasiodiplodia theobromae]KAF9639447.1 Cox20/FAM36A [Lasiodiplodia theobromae]